MNEELFNVGVKLPERKDLCYFFLKGKCDEGEKCNRSHSDPPCLNGTIKKFCIYYSQGRCKKGKLCNYIHDLPDNFPAFNNIPNFQSRNNSCETSQVIINASDDVQSMVDMPKLCRFYSRGMCFFGDNCKNFHDKPEKDLETLFSDLRKDEASRESNEINSPSKNNENSTNLSMASPKNYDTDFNSCEVSQEALSLSNVGECNRRELNRDSSSELSELSNVSCNSSTKSKEFVNSLWDGLELKEWPEVPFSPELYQTKNRQYSSKSKAFTKSSNDASKNLKDRSLNFKEFSKQADNLSSNESLTNSNSNEYLRSASSLSNTDFSKCKEFVPETKGPSKYKEVVKTLKNSNSKKDEVNGISSKIVPLRCIDNTREPSNLSKSKEFDKDLKYSAISEDFVRDQNNLSKSKELATNMQFSNPREFGVRDPCTSSSRLTRFSRPKVFYNYSNSSKFPNDSHSNNRTRVFTRNTYSSNQSSFSRWQENNFKSKELLKNADNPKDPGVFPRLSDNSLGFKGHSDNSFRSVNQLRSMRSDDALQLNVTEELFNDSNDQFQAICDHKSEKQLSNIDDFKEKTENGMNRAMTRKQSKSQRKPKSENKYSRRIF